MPSRGRFLRVLAPTVNYGDKAASARTMPVIIIVFAFLFLCVWMNAQLVKFNKEISTNTKTLERLKSDNRAMEIRLQSMTSSEGIARAAKEKYGFSYPADGQVMHVKKPVSLWDRLFRGKGEK